jgi:hypothetical protein
MYDYEVIGFFDYLLSGPDITMHHSNSPFITHFVAQFVAQNFGRPVLLGFRIASAGAVIIFPPIPSSFPAVERISMIMAAFGPSHHKTRNYLSLSFFLTLGNLSP